MSLENATDYSEKNKENIIDPNLPTGPEEAQFPESEIFVLNKDEKINKAEERAQVLIARAKAAQRDLVRIKNEKLNNRLREIGSLAQITKIDSLNKEILVGAFTEIYTAIAGKDAEKIRNWKSKGREVLLEVSQNG